MITYVTAFLHGSNPKRGYADYKAYFDVLARTGIPILLFLDHRSTWSFPGNVHVERVRFEDTWTAKYIPDTGVLPDHRGSTDTLEYMRIQNTKPEWLWRASHLNPFRTDWFAWIDFGIVHVFRNPEATLERIRTLVPPAHPCIRIAGIWSLISRQTSAVNWRFAGGFLLAHRSRVEDFFTTSCECISETLPAVTWEVNIWAIMESNGFAFEWFHSDHNDTIIPSASEQDRLDRLALSG